MDWETGGIYRTCGRQIVGEEAGKQVGKAAGEVGFVFIGSAAGKARNKLKRKGGFAKNFFGTLHSERMPSEFLFFVSVPLCDPAE